MICRFVASRDSSIEKSSFHGTCWCCVFDVKGWEEIKQPSLTCVMARRSPLLTVRQGEVSFVNMMVPY